MSNLVSSSEELVPQHLDALAKGNRIRIAAANERNELIGAPASEVADALIHPSDELSRMRLRHLLMPRGRNRRGPIPRFGPTKLDRAFADLLELHPHGRQHWHPELRLRDLTESERRHLVEATFNRAPRKWATAFASNTPERSKT